MILITGAAGKTGRAITQKLSAHGFDVRAIVRRDDQISEMEKVGAKEVIVSDLLDETKLDGAFFGSTSIYHICPNMQPQEEEIGQLMIQLAQKNHLKHFVYHSVLHPQVEAMPHHWKKMRVEDHLFRIQMPFTILQPAPYMQNVLGYLDKMLKTGEYRVPYSTSSKSSMIDLNDLAEVVLKVFSEPGHENAIYELSSSETLSALDVATVVAGITGKLILAGKLDHAEWEKNARKSGLSDYEVSTLIKMFEYYEDFDFIGNPNQLSWLLEREPTTFDQFFRNEYKN
ncbi:MAG TPA: NmrA family NAD(P)-binding protein [Anaerolineaceae bacterium]|nr:NmrA family NAD(P)-binding protein [Anaerolineaceae bacterium]